MKKIAIIPARGGSKRIPRKNIKLFLGKPIISYAIDAALNSGEYDEIMVSTDDKEIAEYALSLGASVPFLRSTKNSDDFATTIDVILEVLNFYESKGTFFDVGTCIYPTAPFCTKELLTESINILKKKDLDSVFPIVRYGYPIQRALNFDEKGFIKMIDKSNTLKRSQDFTASYHDAGQFYSFSIEKIKQLKTLMTDNSGAIEISELKVQDIDNEIDWKLAEIKYGL